MPNDKVIISQYILNDIANAIKTKTGMGEQEKIKPINMANTISSISGEAHLPITVNITQSGHQTITVTPVNINNASATGTSIPVPNSVTLNATIVAEEGYIAGTLNQSSVTANWGDTVTFSATEAELIPLVLTNDYYKMRNVYPDTYTTMTTIPDALDTSNLTTAESMFGGRSENDTECCLNLVTIPQIDTSNVTNMSYMFICCSSLTTIPQLNTSKVINMNAMFWRCTSLTSVPQLDTSKATNVGRLFSETLITTIPLMDFSSATIIQAMFDGCSQLQSIPQINTSNATDSRQMFNNCTSLTTIPELDTSKIIMMRNMFQNCTSLPATFPWTINMESVNTSNNNGYSNMFTGSSVTKVRVKRSAQDLVANTMKSGGSITIEYV